MPPTQFNAKMIIFQIIAVLSVFYLSYISSGVFVSLLWGVPFSLNQFLDLSMVSFATSWGRIIVFAIWTAGIVVAYSLPRLVERTRKCFDFVFSFIFIHLIFCWIMNGFSFTYAWLFVYAGLGISSTVLGEYLCMRVEKRDIWVGVSQNGGIENRHHETEFAASE